MIDNWTGRESAHLVVPEMLLVHRVRNHYEGDKLVMKHPRLDVPECWQVVARISMTIGSLDDERRRRWSHGREYLHSDG